MDKKDEENYANDLSTKTYNLIDKSLDAFLKLSPLQQFGAVITIGVTSYFGILRVPPFRALNLGFRSLIKGPRTKSLRSKDVDDIRKSVQNLNKSDDQFLIVKGPKGIGKTVAIQNALAHTWGVCFVKHSIGPGQDKDQIVDEVLSDFTNIQVQSLKKIKAAENIILWNSFFTFLSGRRRKPIVVISAQERQRGEPYAQIAEASRFLASLGLRVIVDSADGALFDYSFTKRESYFEMEPMSLDLIEKMPEIQNLIIFLKKNNLFEEVIINTR